MPVQWTEEEEINLYKSIIRCRPIGIHQNFRMINLYLSINPEPSRFSMSDIREKMDTLYDIRYIQTQELEAQANKTDSEDEQQILPGFNEVAFELPYAEYREVIEAHAKVDAESVPPSPSIRDQRSSPTQSVKTESVAPDGASDEEEQKETTVNKGRPRKRASVAAAAAAVSKERATPRSKHTGSVSGSVGTGTPGKETDEESLAGSTPKANKKARTAPSRKSTRKR